MIISQLSWEISKIALNELHVDFNMRHEVSPGKKHG